MKKRFLTTLATGLFLVGMGVLAAESEASLIFLGDISTEAGQGYGAVDNILSLHKSGGAGLSTDIETGKVAWNGTSDVITGTYALDDPNKTATFSFDYLGIDAASQIRLIWDPSEVGSAAGDDTEVSALTLTIYAPTGAAFWTASLAAPVYHDYVVGPGLGVGDFVYGLDGAQAGALDSALAGIAGGFGSYRLGLESTIGYVDDGPDTWLIGRGPGNPIPEPATMLLFGTGLAGLAGIARRKKK